MVLPPPDRTLSLSKQTGSIDVSDPNLFRQGLIDDLFRDIRKESPISYCYSSSFGHYWSITRYKDIKSIELDVENFSSCGKLGGVIINGEPVENDSFPMFIAMDPPDHTLWRRAIIPALNAANLRRLETQIRVNTIKVLESLPLRNVINWDDLVSIELTAITLAALLGFPHEERRKLVDWSDAMMEIPPQPLAETANVKMQKLNECFSRFKDIWDDHPDPITGPNLLSAFRDSADTRDMSVEQLSGLITLLIIAGSETTRSSISGGMLALCLHPDQYVRMKNDHSLLDTAIPEMLRWQTPIAHMRRTATQNVSFQGCSIKKGDKIVLWYVSANRDDSIFYQPDIFLCDRPNSRQHLAFGHGIHHCVGARLGELQVRILWEEMLKRDASFTLAGSPVRKSSNFSNGFDYLPISLTF